MASEVNAVFERFRLHGHADSGTMAAMLPQSAAAGRATRVIAAVVVAAGVLALLRHQPTPRLAKPVVAAAVAPSADEPPRPLRSWVLSAGGWYIRVDGAEISLPSFAEQTAARPRANTATVLSPFDDVIVHHATAEGFDWRLIAALIYEESRFDPTSESDKGAYGLMQVRPIAADAVGAEHYEAPDDNVRTGTRYLRQLDTMFSDAADHDRLCLVLAAYNMGPGHVRDAQAVARQLGYDPNRWEGAMEETLPLLEDPAVYPQLPNGFAKGDDVVAYVQRILERYRDYQGEAAADPDGDDLSPSDDPSSNG